MATVHELVWGVRIRSTGVIYEAIPIESPNDPTSYGGEVPRVLAGSIRLVSNYQNSNILDPSRQEGCHPTLHVPLVRQDARINRWRVCPVMTDLLLRGALSSYTIAYREHAGRC